MTVLRFILFFGWEGGNASGSGLADVLVCFFVWVIIKTSNVVEIKQDGPKVSTCNSR